MNRNHLLGILTYQAQHRKTFDVCCRLKALGYSNVKLFAIPMSYQKKRQPLIQHRPSSECVIETREFAKNFSYQYIELDSAEEIDEPQETIFLVCGAGILPQSFVDCYSIINSHPGYIPFVRGLDSLKWAIYNGQPIGVTTHLLGNEVDAGEVIQRKLVEVKENDTFHAVAQRQYELEVAMLVDALSLVEENHVILSGGDNPIYRRMPIEKETLLLAKFQEYKRNIRLGGNP